ncbi:MAG: hypothetical protein COV35_00160 [Alphaproteobacteria bacterium CG11_big_fil_rev_8_21_14_0_20_39_49]|nr:MAG: hypothetical protein COV35_00160 [Alphaproteobacteria bacterium CG11_big_fil_rev_8_21_14_0_20_39_49]
MKAESNFDSRKNKAQIYDGYFGGQYQKQHNYNNADIRDSDNPRFFGPVLPKDSENIRRTASKIISKLEGDTFTLVDHGSGDGRNFGEVLKIAQEAQKQGKNVHYIAYDISSGGLEKFRQRLGDYNQYSKSGSRFEGLENVKFKEIKKEISDLGYGGYNAGSAVKENLTVTFLHNDENDERKHSKKLIGPVDMVMSVFGPLSHITKEDERVKALSVFNEMLREGGAMYATLPSKRRFTKEQEAFGMLRDMKRAPDDVVEDDVVLYKRPDGTVLPYKLYTEKSIKSEFEKAGFEGATVGISNAIHQDTLFKYAILAQVESCLTSIIPGLPAELGNYMYVIASAGKSRDLSKHSSNVSTPPLTSDSSAVSVANSKYEFEGIRDTVMSEVSRSPSHLSSVERESSGLSSASTLSSSDGNENDVDIDGAEHKRHLSDGTVDGFSTKRNRSGSISKPSIKSKSWSSGLATGAEDCFKKDKGSIGK